MIKVLAVDDHPVFLQGLVSILQGIPDFEVVGQATSGNEAVQMAMELKPDVIVMDLNMAGGSGVEATAVLRDRAPKIRVLILTVSDNESDLLSSVEAGARGYLLKTAELDELIHGIKMVAAGDVILPSAMALRVMEQLHQKRSDRGGGDVSGLSQREIEVLNLVAQGASNKEIAGRLFITESTVKAHLRSILEKLQVKNRAQAVAKAKGSVKL